MNRPTSTHARLTWLAGALLAVGLLLAAPAPAQTITVTSAVPDMADQGTLGLVVAISGDGFAKGSKVDFFVSGTTNPGGITVKSVKYKNPKALEATIDVAPDAQTSLKFDIQVMSGSRTGKGTELFKVNVKVTGTDTIPPGTITDLTAVDVGYSAARLSYTVPADDGWNLASGPPEKWQLRVRRDWSPERPECGRFEAWPESWADDPCHAWGNAGIGFAQAPGESDSTYAYLAPGTTYWAVIRTTDDAMPDAHVSSLDSDLAAQVSFTTAEAPATNWSTGIVDGCPPLWQDTDCVVSGDPRLDFDAAGEPTLVYVVDGQTKLASRGSGGWLIEALPAHISGGDSYHGGATDFRFDPAGRLAIVRNGITGTKWDLRYFVRSGDSWSNELVTTSAGRGTSLAYNPVDGTPTIAYTASKGSGQVLRVAERRGSSWTSQTVAPSTKGDPELVFDPSGRPAVLSRIELADGQNAAGFALRASDGTWALETVEVPSLIQDPAMSPSGTWVYLSDCTLAFDPVRGDFSAAYAAVAGGANTYCDTDSWGDCLVAVRYCERAAGSPARWACETVDSGGFARPGALAFAADGTAYLTDRNGNTRFVAFRPPGGAWQKEYVDWNGAGQLGQACLRIGAQGQVGVAYPSGFDAPLGVKRGLVSFALRPAPTPPSP